MKFGCQSLRGMNRRRNSRTNMLGTKNFAMFELNKNPVLLPQHQTGDYLMLCQSQMINRVLVMILWIVWTITQNQREMVGSIIQICSII